MSFSQEVKLELSEVECTTHAEMKAQAYGMTIFSKLHRTDKALFATESQTAARVYSQLMTIITGSIFDVNIPLNRKSLRDKQITVTSPDFADRNSLLLYFGHIENELSLHINRANFESEESFPSFLRGAFLSYGNVTDPQKDYHLEFVSPFQNLAKDLSCLIEEIEQLTVKPKLINRKGSFIIYLKDSEGISDLLTLIGAQMSALKIIQEKMVKSVRNTINRKINSETANSNKTAKASAKQLLAIDRIKKKRGLESLPSELYELAILRVENPESSLRELGEMLNPPISRSGVNHRMERIMELAEELTGG